MDNAWNISKAIAKHNCSIVDMPTSDTPLPCYQQLIYIVLNALQTHLAGDETVPKTCLRLFKYFLVNIRNSNFKTQLS